MDERTRAAHLIVDMGETWRALVQHTSGDLWIVDLDAQEPASGHPRIVGAVQTTARELGAALGRDWPSGEYGLPPALKAAMADVIASAVNLGIEDIEWLQAEEAGSRLRYPLALVG